MRENDNIIFYILTYPFIWIYETLEFIFYMYLSPIWTGKAVPDGWNPLFVKEEQHGLWKPSARIDIPYKEYMKLTNEELMELGFERSKHGYLTRVASPQMIYADPEKAHAWGDSVKKYYDKELSLIEEEKKKEMLLDPSEVVTYYNKIFIDKYEIFSYNIQMKISFLHWKDIDMIELFFTFIFFLCLLLAYFIFYHLYKLNIKLQKAEEILNENSLSLYEKDEEITAQVMHSYWREGSRISDTFDLGIELDYCVYEGTLIGFESFILLSIIYVITSFYLFFYNYIYKFYIYNVELCTYFFFYFFLFLSIFYWFKYKREQKKAIHRWVELDYYFSHFLNHYFRTLSWLNLYKLVCDVPLFFYVLVYTLVMVWIYFACDSCDYFMGWNQEYRIDIYNRQTNMHFWWPRVLMNQTWYHFYIVLLKPWHIRIVYLLLYLFLPVVAFCLLFVYVQNKIHVWVNNKFFFWNSRRYTIDEIKEQWQKDKKANYIDAENEKNNKERGLIIL